ncbi:Tetraacyldisaccharide 4'-kinase [Polystyrenella longa]|uniref:Tetraacyldisaccharide 4'-kinase n=1 Tax=Polystyrenella longa TaxID=2528007 RepID=A0A518CI27_9PLAN|nr:tetraacyldisaccharide 4'-kinase [Polystyrenella longa]QDU78888.1 Tetraacyldisaccharide 4'-kinase [Polystyrenella longa]
MDEAKFRKLISGEKKSFAAKLARGVLYICSFFYGTVVWFRNFSYDVKWLRAQKSDCAVVSVGNITAGGTGKTPVVAYIANWFERKGFSVVIVSRGYHQLAESVNDEKLVLDRLCPGIPHILNKNRVEAAKQAIEEYDAEVVVLDDAFQHRRIYRDLNLVLLDLSAPFGYDYLLPRGLLREHPEGLKRADLVMLTRVNQTERGLVTEVQQKQQSFRQASATTRQEKDDLAAVEVSFPPERFLNASGVSTELDKLQLAPVAAFCGIGNPEAFRQSLEKLGLEVAYFRAFPDHHHYREEELDEVAHDAKQAGCSQILTTLKDLVKIEKDKWGKLSLWAVTTGIDFEKGRELLDDKLEDVAHLIREKRDEAKA